MGMDLDTILKVAVRGGASDILLKVDSRPRFRFQGEIVSLSDGEKVSPEIMAEWIQNILPTHLVNQFAERGDVDFSYCSRHAYRFRVNLFRQRSQSGLVLRVISSHIRTMEELQFPKVIEKFTTLPRGLVLVTGATGSGKTTSLAAMIQRINTESPSHIITIEDPIEFEFKDARSVINQREVGIDAATFSSALRASLRQDPDVILVGELRDRETTETALMAAETGHLVFSTLHTLNAVESLTRLMSYFEPHQHQAIRLMLAQTLQAVISQRLVKRANGNGMAAAFEILVSTERVREIIEKSPSFTILHQVIKEGKDSYGMQSFDASLLSLYEKGIITKQEALDQASNRDDMALFLTGVGT